MQTTNDGATSSTGAKLHFSRFEFKYVLPRARRDELEKEFQYFVELDPYVAQEPGAKYFVRSLYFDNAALDCYWEKEDGKKHRQKFRVRTYTTEPGDGTPTFLEIKGRHNNLVFKHRAPLRDEPRTDVPSSLVFDETTNDLLARLEDDPVRESFEFDLHRRRLRPTMLVDYERRPYVSRLDPEFRLTFDDSLHGTRSDRLHPEPSAVRQAVLPGWTIVEVKFRYHLPKWFHRLIQSYELRRVSISKYCKCCQVLGVAPDQD